MQKVWQSIPAKNQYFPSMGIHFPLMGIHFPLMGIHFPLMGSEFPLMGNTDFFAGMECHKKEAIFVLLSTILCFPKVASFGVVVVI